MYVDDVPVGSNYIYKILMVTRAIAISSAALALKFNY